MTFCNPSTRIYISRQTIGACWPSQNGMLQVICLKIQYDKVIKKDIPTKPLVSMLVHIAKQNKKKKMALPLQNAMFKINLYLSFLSPGAPHKLEFRLRYVFGLKGGRFCLLPRGQYFRIFCYYL